MENATIERWDVNVEALDAELRTVLGKKVTGISTGPKGVTVHLEGADSSDVTKATQIVLLHDPTKLTANQQAEADEWAALEIARSENTSALDITQYASTGAEILTLAQKVAWLEKEINFLNRTVSG